MHGLTFLLLVVLALAGFSWLKRTPPAQRTRVRNQLVVAGAIVLLLAMVVRGGLHPLFAIIGATATLVVHLVMQQVMRRVHAEVGRWPGDGEEGAGSSRRSTVRTRYLRAHLDHETGEMDAEVLEGRYRGRRLSELDLAALRELLREVDEDRQSRALLAAYLERSHGDRWSDGDHSSEGSRRAGSEMTDSEAREVLGVDSSAGRAEIVAAHRRLIQKLHPDRGGSTYLAAILNDAKRQLLGEG